MMLLLNLIGIALTAFIVWWFWLSHSKTVSSHLSVTTITVKDGVYSPARIAFSTTQPIVLEFIRLDTSGCSDTVIFPALNQQFRLPHQQSTRIDLGQLPKGGYEFACPMKMYQGKIVVK